MVFVCHLIYTAIAFFYICSLDAPILEEYVKLSRKKQRHYENAISGCMVLIALFPVMNILLQRMNPDLFPNGFTRQIITVIYAEAMLLVNKRNKNPESKRPTWIIPLAYFIYTVVDNWSIMKSIFWILDFLVAEVISLVFLAAFAFLPSMIIENSTPITAAEQEQRDKELEESRIRWAQEKEERKREKEAREAQESASYTYSNGDDEDSKPSGWGWFKQDEFDKMRQTNYFTSDMETCSNCTHYRGGKCTCEYSSSYDLSINNPRMTNCGFHFPG